LRIGRESGAGHQAGEHERFKNGFHGDILLKVALLRESHSDGSQFGRCMYLPDCAPTMLCKVSGNKSGAQR
ncbi:hypothetical protein, partial [Rhodoferax saidenbachensis]|uniref:hypothetical protein n=1 Tax=Rhodoferax saidenbachensis TaxID=1484693 RepID=UPI0019D3EF18